MFWRRSSAARGWSHARPKLSAETRCSPGRDKPRLDQDPRLLLPQLRPERQAICRQKSSSIPHCGTARANRDSDGKPPGEQFRRASSRSSVERRPQAAKISSFVSRLHSKRCFLSPGGPDQLPHKSVFGGNRSFSAIVTSFLRPSVCSRARARRDFARPAFTLQQPCDGTRQFCMFRH